MNGRDEGSSGVSRRNFLRAGLGGTGLLGIAALGVARGPLAGGPLLAQAVPADGHDVLAMGMHPMPAVVGEVDHARNGFNPTNTLIDFDGGTVSSLPTGQTLREFTLVAQNTSLEIVPGVAFAAWTYNGRIPGPTIRVSEGDRVRIAFRNDGDHPHSVHFVPVAKDDPPLRTLAVLGLIGGAPAIIGAWVGGLVTSQPLSVLFLAVGAGAVLQVAFEIGRQMVWKKDATKRQPLVVFAGVLAGMVVLYVTGVAIK